MLNKHLTEKWAQLSSFYKSRMPFLQQTLHRWQCPLHQHRVARTSPNMTNLTTSAVEGRRDLNQFCVSKIQLCTLLPKKLKTSIQLLWMDESYRLATRLMLMSPSTVTWTCTNFQRALLQKTFSSDLVTVCHSQTYTLLMFKVLPNLQYCSHVWNAARCLRPPFRF